MQQPTSTDSPTRIDFSLLDQLRGLAAAAVVIGHSRGLLYIGGRELLKIKPMDEWSLLDKVAMGILSLTRLAPEFVIFFFVLSGFSIAYSINHSSNLLRFYQRRALRLYPTYLGGLLWAATVFILTLAWRPDFYSGIYKYPTFIKLQASADFLSASNVIRNLTYLPNGFFVEPYWSLSHEVIFYAIAPVALLNLKAYYSLSLLLYTTGWGLTGSGFSNSGILSSYVFDYNIYFMIGIAAYFNWSRLICMLTIPQWGVGLVLAAIYLTSVGLGAVLGSASKYSAALFCAASLILIVNLHAHGWRNRTMRFLGECSYTLYVTHFSSLILLLAAVHSFIPPPHIHSKILWLIGVPFCVFTTIPFYLLIERRVKHALQYLRKD